VVRSLPAGHAAGGEKSNAALRELPLRVHADVGLTSNQSARIGIAADYRIRFGLHRGDGRMRLVAEQGAARAGVGAGFFGILDSVVARLRPSADALDRDGERELARWCYVLALFDEVFRGGYCGACASPCAGPARPGCRC
jgi:hypothetical protein